jgi:hypothetical protein
MPSTGSRPLQPLSSLLSGLRRIDLPYDRPLFFYTLFFTYLFYLQHYIFCYLAWRHFWIEVLDLTVWCSVYMLWFPFLGWLSS